MPSLQMSAMSATSAMSAMTAMNDETLEPCLSSDEALALLGAGLPSGGTSLEGLVHRLGYWPLFLQIVNRQLRETMRGSALDLAEAVQEMTSALDAVDLVEVDARDPEAVHVAAVRLLVVILRTLPDRDRDRWLDLAVFPASQAIPLATVRSFWGLGRAEARQLCRRLGDLGLLVFDGWATTVRLHPLVSCFLARRRQAELPALRARLQEIQRSGS